MSNCVGRFAEPWEFSVFWCSAEVMVGKDMSGHLAQLVLTDYQVDFLAFGIKANQGMECYNLTTGLFGTVTGVTNNTQTGSSINRTGIAPFLQVITGLIVVLVLSIVAWLITRQVYTLKNWLFTLAFVCMGLELSVTEIKRMGWGPVIVFLIVTVFNTLLALIVSYLLFGFWFPVL